jgi:hypothetical protein
MNGIDETLPLCNRHKMLTIAGCCRTGLYVHVGLKARVAYKLIFLADIRVV